MRHRGGQRRQGDGHDKRKQVVVEGQVRLAGLSGASLSLIRTLSDEDDAALVDSTLSLHVRGLLVAQGVPYPFPRKSGPNKVVKVLARPAGKDVVSVARLLRLARLSSVDSCFHLLRRNVRFASWPSISSCWVGPTWDRHHLCKPEPITKTAEIAAFTVTGASRAPTRKRPRCAWGWHAGASRSGISCDHSLGCPCRQQPAGTSTLTLRGWGRSRGMERGMQRGQPLAVTFGVPAP